jgi:electron transfer flavoprotein alpha subunit
MMDDYKGVTVLGEIAEGKLSSITADLLGGGRKLADQLEEELSCLLLGYEASGVAKEAIAYGADKVYVVEDAQLMDYQGDTYTPAVAEIVKEILPRILLFGQNNIGRDLAPRLAFRLRTGLSTDCIELDIDPETKLLQQTRPVYGGNALATVMCQTLPQMATVRRKAMSSLVHDDTRKGKVVTFSVTIDPDKVRTRIVNRVTEEAPGIRLEDAPVIVSGGRGIGGLDGFKYLKELAELLKGAVGATRLPCESGWVPAAVQIGLTGKVVTPELYFAIALSAASQHLAGCLGAKTIVAINRDPDANIFNVAHFGAVGDWKQILPSFIEKVKEFKSK